MSKMWRKFIKLDKIYFKLKNVVNMFIAYELETWSYYWEIAFFGVVKLTKNADPDKYRILDMVLGFRHMDLFYCLMVSFLKMLFLV